MSATYAIDLHQMFVPTGSLLELVVRGSLMYLLILAGFRIFRRDAGSLSVSDLLVVVLIADAAQNAMSAEYNSVGGTGTFSGTTYNAGDTLVKYTWNGDANLDGRVTFDDYTKIDTGFNQHFTGWLNGDFNYSGSVSFDDYVLIDIAFNQQSGTLARAIDWISGDDRSAAGLDTAGLGEVIGHFGQFGTSYGAAFLAAVPEPASLALLGLPALAGMFVRRRRRM